MMKMHVDTAYRSLFKYGEELCGDNVRITRTEDSVLRCWRMAWEAA